MTDLNELKLSLAGKVFLAGAAAWVIGKASGLKIRGRPEEVAAIRAALIASRRFQDELARPGATVESVIEKLRLKDATGADFERITGVPWPL